MLERVLKDRRTCESRPGANEPEGVRGGCCLASSPRCCGQADAPGPRSGGARPALSWACAACPRDAPGRPRTRRGRCQRHGDARRERYFEWANVPELLIEHSTVAPIHIHTPQAIAGTLDRDIGARFSTTDTVVDPRQGRVAPGLPGHVALGHAVDPHRVRRDRGGRTRRGGPQPGHGRRGHGRAGPRAAAHCIAARRHGHPGDGHLGTFRAPSPRPVLRRSQSDRVSIGCNLLAAQAG